jgi:hypothetical protein
MIYLIMAYTVCVKIKWAVRTVGCNETNPMPLQQSMDLSQQFQILLTMNVSQQLGQKIQPCNCIKPGENKMIMKVCLYMC